ncbi:hypothetical protein LCGC14_2252880, partial [marine sediment metagenome]
MNMMTRVYMDGTCYVCDKEAKLFASPSPTDSGPWVCDDCANIVEKYLKHTGYSLCL